MEPEYRIVKCPTCWQDMRGPRIVRLSESDKQEVTRIKKQLKKKERLFISASLLGLISSFASFFVGLAYFKETEFWIIIVVSTIVYVLIVLPAIFLVSFKELDKRFNHILQLYGVEKRERYELFGWDEKTGRFL